MTINLTLRYRHISMSVVMYCFVFGFAFIKNTILEIKFCSFGSGQVKILWLKQVPSFYN